MPRDNHYPKTIDPVSSPADLKFARSIYKKVYPPTSTPDSRERAMNDVLSFLEMQGFVHTSNIILHLLWGNNVTARPDPALLRRD